MAVNLLKTVVNLTKTAEKVKTKAKVGRVSLEKPSSSLEDAIRDVDKATDLLEKDCPEPDDGSAKKPRQKKQRVARGAGKKAVQVRPPRHYTPRDVKRIAEKVIDRAGGCPSVGALVAAGVMGAVGAEHWVDAIIRMVWTVHEMYVILYDGVDMRGYIDEINSYKSGVVVIGDIFNGVIDFVAWLLDVPRELVLLLSPLDRFMLALHRFLVKFRDLIVQML